MLTTRSGGPDGEMDMEAETEAGDRQVIFMHAYITAAVADTDTDAAPQGDRYKGSDTDTVP